MRDLYFESFCLSQGLFDKDQTWLPTSAIKACVMKSIGHLRATLIPSDMDLTLQRMSGPIRRLRYDEDLLRVIITTRSAYNKFRDLPLSPDPRFQAQYSRIVALTVPL